MATGVGRGKMLLAAFDGPFPKTPYRRKNLAKISYASRVISHFVPNFVAMATRKRERERGRKMGKGKGKENGVGEREGKGKGKGKGKGEGEGKKKEKGKGKGKGKGRWKEDSLRNAGKHSAQLSFMGTELHRFEVPISRNANF